MSRNRKTVKNSLVDVALLTCGLVEPKIFQDCINSIKREMETVESQFYVIFNGLEKEARPQFEQMAQTIPNGRVLYSNPRVGFPAGANKVIRRGTSPFVLFITDDIILDEGSLKILLDKVMSVTEIGLCGMKLIFPKDSSDKGRPAGRVQHIGHGIDIRGEITHPLLGWSPENPRCNVSREVLSVTGGVFMARRTAFLRAGGFWEGYGLGYFEDVDLCLTLREQGWKIWVETSATAIHYTNASMLKANQPIPMDYNKMLFRNRKGKLLINDSWTFW